jgi:hypothetical protein
MRWHVLYLILFSSVLYAADFNFPSNMQIQDIPVIVRTFNLGFLARTPLSLIGQDKYNTQISVRVNNIDTSKVARLGSQSKSDDVTIQEFSFSKKLPLDVELGAQASLSMLDRNINTFGGYARWGLFLYPWGTFSFIGHGTSGNYKSEIGMNLFGALLSFDTQLGPIHLSVGAGNIRSTNTFDSSLFGTTTAQQALTYSRIYSHQMAKLSYLWDGIYLNAQGDWLRDFFGSISIGYLF